MVLSCREVAPCRYNWVTGAQASNLREAAALYEEERRGGNADAASALGVLYDNQRRIAEAALWV